VSGETRAHGPGLPQRGSPTDADTDRVTPVDDDWADRFAAQLAKRSRRREVLARTRAEMKSRRDLGKRIGHARKLRGGNHHG
jgi:hypothetical protein